MVGAGLSCAFWRQFAEPGYQFIKLALFLSATCDKGVGCYHVVFLSLKQDAGPQDALLKSQPSPSARPLFSTAYVDLNTKMTTLSLASRLSRPHQASKILPVTFLLLSRNQHTQTRKQHTVTASTSNPSLQISQAHVSTTKTSQSPLSLLALPVLLRSWAITGMSSYSIFLTPALKLMSLIAHSSSPLLNPDRNPLLHFLFKKTFYAQFCAGETPTEVQATAQGLRNMGFRGVILAYGKEIVLERGEKARLLSKAPTNSAQPTTPEDQACASKDVATWKRGTLATVDMTQEGDFVALKFSGAGKDAMRQLACELPPSPELEAAMVEICDLAHSKGVGLLFDAEQNAVQRGIDAWTLDFQRRCNKQKAVVYGTYQAYLQSTPTTIAKHLTAAEKGGFTLGVKLVRGAYMASDPRHIFWSTKPETDKAYDGITQALICRSWNDVLKPPAEGAQMAEVNLVLASHNQESVTKCMHVRRQRTLEGKKNVQMAYGQLMGMADEVSCELILAAHRADLVSKDANIGSNTYKYLVWGSVGECLKYLIRRAEENRGAVSRARGSRMALTAELKRRILG